MKEPRETGSDEEDLQMSVTEELRAAIAAVADGTAGGVVAVGRGAGTVIAPGYVLTNAHNLRGESVSVRFPDGRVVEGEVTAADEDGDLAVVAVDTGEAPALAWADRVPTVGTAVLAVAPTRSGGPRVTFGLVSADGQAFRGPRGGRIQGAVEHTAPLGRGSSGGPIVGLDGGLLGINTHRRGDGFYLAQPVSPTLRDRIDGLVRGEAPRGRYLGIAIAPSHVATRLRAAVGLDARDGVLVRGVDPGGPADRAEVRPGDLIVAAAGEPVTTPDDLRDRVDAATDHLLLTLVRGVDELEVRVEFDGDGPTEPGEEGTA
jgi:serine protease Do